MANGVLASAKQRKYKIPEDVAIIGYDDLPTCQYSQPAMSSIHTNYEDLGIATMRALRERISNTDLKTNMVSFVPVSVSIRNSS
jgi:DNA-binding LacI/PurR family transcriptional regulator